MTLKTEVMNDCWKFSFAITGIKYILDTDILEYVYCIFDRINALLVSMRDFKNSETNLTDTTVFK